MGCTCRATQSLMKEQEQEMMIEQIGAVLFLHLPEFIAEIMFVAIQKAFVLEKIEEHEAV